MRGKEQIKMNKIAFVIIVTMLMSSLSGCMSQWVGILYDPHHRLQEKVMERLMDRLIPALDNDDREALKDLFSESVLEEARNIEEDIDLIMEFYQGEMTELHCVSRNSATDTTRTRFGGVYTITTTRNAYRLEFIYVYADDNPANEGLHLISLVLEEDRSAFGWAASISVPKLHDGEYHELLDEVMERIIAVSGCVRYDL